MSLSMFLDGSRLARLPVKKDPVIELIEIKRQDLGGKAVIELRIGRHKSLGRAGRIPLPGRDMNHDELDRPGIGRFGVEDLDAAVGRREPSDDKVEERPFGLDQLEYAPTVHALRSTLTF